MTLPKSNPMLWVGYPKSYTPGRNRAPKLIVWHHTAGSEGPKSAEAGAAYDKTRLDGTSCHAFFDSEGPGLQELPFGDRSHTAFFYGNEIGVHFELCGTLQTREQWLDPISLATLRTAAEAGRYTGEVLGIAPKRLSDAEVRRAWDVGDVTGHCDHWVITRVFGLGNHTDVGPYFPWDVFMPMIAGSAPTQQEDDVPGLFKLPDNSTLYMSDGFKRKTLDGAMWADFKETWGNVPIATVANMAALDAIAGPDWTTVNPPCECNCNCEGSGEPTLVEHTHDTAATGPAIPTT